MANELRDAAHSYASGGWPVFPCEPRGKRPLGRLVPHGLKQASADHRLIEKWWRAAPDANIGLPTGICFDVLDVDHPQGWTSLARLVDAHGPLELGAVALTGGGGAHDLFSPTGAGNRAGLAPGLDWRGAGGYIVAPPSVHASGRLYEWAIELDDPDFPLVEPPKWLANLVLRPAPPRSAPPIGVVHGAAYAKAALADEVQRVATAPEGTRNDTLNRAAFSLAGLIASGLVDADEVASALLAAAARAGLGGTEAARTLASGFRAGLAAPRGVPWA